MGVYNRKSQVEKAVSLRNDGFSYSYIQNLLNLPKSTVSDWVKNTPYTPNKISLNIIKRGSEKSSITRRQKRDDNFRTNKLRAIEEIGQLTKRDLLLFGIGLYLGEGSKAIESVRITNSDPRVIKLAISWFIKIIGLTLENLSLALHSYPDNNVDEDLDYWANITGIPRSQFGKTQIDGRGGKRIGHKLPHGTIQIRVLAKGESRFGVSLHRRIMAWIDAVAEYRGDLV